MDERFAAAYDYALPPELIAQLPAARRDEARLMVLAGGQVAHAHFSDLPAQLRAGDVLAINETRVIAARLAGTRLSTGSPCEILLLHPAGTLRYDSSATRWIALTRPARRLRVGTRVAFGDAGEATVTAELEEGVREIELALRVPFDEFLAKAGAMPLPPYIHGHSPEAQARYQSVFARVPGSVAAPTASLHFTPELLDEVARGGVEVVRITLDVGLGTFRPMTEDRIEDHVMHAEAYEISAPAADAIERARTQGRRIVAVGTTVVRALEGNARMFGRVRSGQYETDLFVRPGFEFGVVDAMITNFHLPRSTLLVLVSAFAGRERMLAAYREAIEMHYRFYSFGDAMFIER